jgi:hypothetical protein
MKTEGYLSSLSIVHFLTEEEALWEALLFAKKWIDDEV